MRSYTYLGYNIIHNVKYECTFILIRTYIRTEQCIGTVVDQTRKKNKGYFLFFNRFNAQGTSTHKFTQSYPTPPSLNINPNYYLQSPELRFSTIEEAHQQPYNATAI